MYAPILSKILSEEGMPRDLIYLAMAESGFHNKAKSWAKAVGPWCRQSADLPHGLDHCFVNRFVAQATKDTLPLQARLSHGSGKAQRTLELRSSQPGVQVYVSTYLSKPFAPYQGICLEAQNFPDAPNRPDFPSAVLRPGELYQQQIFYRFS